MRKIFFVLILSICTNSFGQVIVYNIPLGQLVNLGSNCGSTNSQYNGCAGNAGFTWISTGAGAPSSIQVEYTVGVECLGLGFNYIPTLNGNANTPVPSTDYWCSCDNSFGPSSIESYAISPVGYNVGGSNTLMITGLGNCWGVIADGSLGAGVYARITVNYGPPVNDNPCTATSLTASYACIYGTSSNTSATATAGIPAPGCATYSGGDVWFSVVVPAGGALNIDTQIGGLTDAGMAVYSGTCAAMTLIACDDNTSANGNMPMISLTGQTVGSTLWIRVWDVNNDQFGTFGICVVDPNAPVPVMGTGAIYAESNVGSPWGSTSNQDAMNSVFGAAWSMTYFETMNPAAIFVPANCFIFLEGGDGTANELNSFLQTNLPLIESWVAMGGRLLLNSAPNEGGNINFGFGGVLLNYDGWTSLGPLGNASPGQAGHPIFNGPFLPCGTAFSGNYFAHSWISGGGTTAIMEDTPGPSLTEKVWGNGRVLFGGWTSVDWATTPFPNITNLFANMISYQADCQTPLPVELGSFTGTCSNNGTLLNWTTYSETNNASFIVQSSTEGFEYTTESTLQGAGNSNQLLEYSFLSPFRSYPGNYFRLIQKDYDGTEHIYGPIYISCHETTNANCAVVNVNNDEVNLSIYSAKDDVLTCSLMDIQGKELVSVTKTVTKGTSSFSFDGTQLSAGVYIVLINGSESQCSNKFIKQ